MNLHQVCELGADPMVIRWRGVGFLARPSAEMTQLEGEQVSKALQYEEPPRGTGAKSTGRNPQHDNGFIKDPPPWGPTSRMLVESDLSDAEVRMTTALLIRQGSQGYITYGQQYVADMLGWRTEKVKVTGESLRQRGIIDIEGTGRQTRRYKVLFDPVRGKVPLDLSLSAPNPARPSRVKGNQRDKLTLTHLRGTTLPSQVGTTSVPARSESQSQAAGAYASRVTGASVSYLVDSLENSCEGVVVSSWVPYDIDDSYDSTSRDLENEELDRIDLKYSQPVPFPTDDDVDSFAEAIDEFQADDLAFGCSSEDTAEAQPHGTVSESWMPQSKTLGELVSA
jgi:hypothetical protein